MDYNSHMKGTRPHTDVLRLIRFAAILWIGYLVALALISQSLQSPRHTEPLYYILYGAIALICLGLAHWSWIQERLRRAFIPVIIAIITVMPVSANYLMVQLFPTGRRFGPEGAVLGLLPFLFIALVLVAWQYKWQYILLIILGTAVLNLVVLWSSAEPGTLDFSRGITITLIQTVIFLAVGFSISYLMSRLREQQQSLETANIRLIHHASTVEHLATSRERNRVARELHDTLAHTLSGLSVQLETTKAYWEVDQQKAHSMLEKSLASIRSGLDETRRALKALRASPLDDLGLVLAVTTMIEGTAERTNLALDLSMMDKMPALSPDVEQCVYRVAQEAVANVVKHANAETLAVKLEFIDGKVTLIVHDDGVGFDIEKSKNTSHFGLAGIRERAQLIGGELNVISKPGFGTTIYLTI